MKKKIYLSIPISGKDEKKQREKADLIKAKLSKEGYEVVNPFDIYSGEKPTYFDYIAHDIRALADCDTAYFCIGWEKSRGCQLERAFCDIYGKEKKFESSDIWR